MKVILTEKRDFEEADNFDRNLWDFGTHCLVRLSSVSVLGWKHLCEMNESNYIRICVTSEF